MITKQLRELYKGSLNFYERREKYMGKLKMANFLAGAKTSIVKHAPTILTATGIAGMITTTVLAVKATPKALELLEERKKEEHKEKLTAGETIQTTWKCYVPAVITCALSVACLIGANSENTKRNTALAAAYRISESALHEYQNKVKETIGEEREQEIREKIDKDRVDNQPVSKNTVIVTNRGNTLCFDSISKRYFYSDMCHLEKVQNELNKSIISSFSGYLSLNELYDEIGLEHISIGNDLGWNIDNLIEFVFSSQISDDDRPCIVVNHANAPKYNFADLY